MLPPIDKEQELASEDGVQFSSRAVVVTEDGRVRLLLINSGLSWIDLDGHLSKKFVSATYCSSVERICANTDSGDLVFFKLTDLVSRLRPEREKDKIKSPTKLIVHQPLDSETLDSLSLNYLTLAEKLPVTCNPSVSAAS